MDTPDVRFGGTKLVQKVFLQGIGQLRYCHQWRRGFLKRDFEDRMFWLHAEVRTTLFSNNVFYGRELPTQHLLIGEPESSDTPGLLEPLISAFIFLAIVAWTIDLDDEVKRGQVEIRDPVVGRVEPLLKTVGKAERSEVGAEQVFGRGCPLFSLSDENGVLLRAGELGERDTLHDGHTRILMHTRRSCRGKNDREF